MRFANACHAARFDACVGFGRPLPRIGNRYRSWLPGTTNRRPRSIHFLNTASHSSQPSPSSVGITPVMTTASIASRWIARTACRRRKFELRGVPASKLSRRSPVGRSDASARAARVRTARAPSQCRAASPSGL